MTKDDVETKREQGGDWSPASHQPGASVGGGAHGAPRLSEYARLREVAPLAWTEDWGGYWTLLKFADVKMATRDVETYRSGRPFMQIPDTSDEYPIIPLSLNPPIHTAYRKALSTYFRDERIDEIEPVYRSQIVRLVDGLVDGTVVDVVPQLCAQSAARGLATLLNLPEEASQDLLDELDGVIKLREKDLAEPGQSVDREGEDPNRFFTIFHEHVFALVQERRERPLDPATDIFTGLIEMEIDGEPLDDHAIAGIGVMLLGAGHATTRDAIGTALHHLAVNGGDQARLRSNPSLIPAAIEEFVRYDTPTQELVRRAARDIELHGRTIKAGDYIALSFGSANRDPDAFDHPNSVIIDRSPNRHVGFGFGVHQCIGRPLARLEMRVVLEEILSRTNSFELAGRAEPNTSSEFGGFASVPIQFTPA